MAKIIAISVDVNKINKAKLYKGEKGTYLNLMVEVKDGPDQYGNDASCWEGQTKDERAQKVNRNYLGNGKTVWSSESAPQPQQGGFGGQYNAPQSGMQNTPPPAYNNGPTGEEPPF